MVVSHKTVFRCHRLRTPRAGSRGLLRSWLGEDNQYIRTTWDGREGGERRKPQVQFLVVEGLQYAVLAKWVNGAYDEIWLELSGVIA